MMMEDLVKILISIVVIVGLTLLLSITNLKKQYRARQVFLPIVAASYDIVAIYYIYKYYKDLEELFSMLLGLLKNVDAEEKIVPFLQDMEVVILNVILMIGFLAIKGALLPVAKKLCGKRELLEKVATTFYYFDEEDYEEWFLHKKWVNFRGFLFAISCGASVAAGLYLGLAWMLGKEVPLWNLAFPCAAVLVLVECYNHVNGLTKEEFEHVIYGEEADSRKISHFYKVREILEQMLPEPLLSSYTGYEYDNKETPVDMMEEWKKSGNHVDIVTAEYFEVDNRYMRADIDFVQATNQMMHRENVVFFHPFYRDMSLYVTLPLVNALLAGKKCTVITGRRSNRLDVKAWLTEILSRYSHMRTLWRVELLSKEDPDCEVGILTFSQLYDKQLIATNQEFLQETDFVILIEPSLIVNTGQVALSIITQEMEKNGTKPVYCVIDRKTDGLVDTLSHIIRGNITNVVAPPVPRCIYTAMGWDANGDFIRQQLFDKQTRYLGNGMEIAAIAIKNQIPKVSWYSETKVPMEDVKWIAGQNHPTICRYMNLPAQQKTLYEKVEFVSNIWNTGNEKEKFLIVEDEFCNMFGMMRAYLSRGVSQSFVNVMSENYLLRDYMKYNRQMFMSNPNAIPSVVPDYAKTERNTLLKLLLLMTLRPVTEEEIIDEFHLVGVETDDALDVMTKMLEKYTFVDNSIFTIQSVRGDKTNVATVTTTQYLISKEDFDECFADSLKNAYFILEEEKHEQGYIDAKLFNHVVQIILPGQFVTYDGKYYMAKHVSPQSGVVLRRASDLYDGRKYYRQIREYILDEVQEEQLVNLRTVMDIELAYYQMDFAVRTTGYLEMGDNHDLRRARKVDFTGDPSIENYSRKYHNKTVLRVRLPETDDKMRFTICLLLSEVFKSVFPDGWPYLAVVSKSPDDIDGMLNYMVYDVNGSIDDEYIYIIEDSDLDLGLLEAVDRNFMKLMEIVSDFIEWHFEKMSEPVHKDPVPVSVNSEEKKKIKKKQGLFDRLRERVGSIFGGKTKKMNASVGPNDINNIGNIKDLIDLKPDSEPDSDSKPDTDSKEDTDAKAETDVSFAEEEIRFVLGTKDSGDMPAVEKKAVEKKAIASKKNSAPELVDTDDTDVFEEDVIDEFGDELERRFEDAGMLPVELTRYQESCFLKFGYPEIDSRLKLDEVHRYLRVHTWSNNSLTKARKRNILTRRKLDIKAENTCDFCMMPLSGVSYEMLNDGRIRCNDCSRNTITTEKEFRKMFYQVLKMMEVIYGVKYRVPISVSMVDARKIAKGVGSIFKPSKEYAGRTLGYAQYRWGKYSVLIENGSPRLGAIETMSHELTHIWQYLNWNDREFHKYYGMNCADCSNIARLIVYEGMAMWVAVQYLYQIGETYYASQAELLANSRTDVYGIGFRLFCEQYPLIRDSELIKYSPFTEFPPVEPEKVKGAVKAVCRKPDCRC